jgi:hypothetical protein
MVSAAGPTRTRSATAGERELCFHFILHNSSFSLYSRRPAVGCIVWLGCEIDNDVNKRNCEEYVSPLWAEPLSFACASASEIFPDATSRRASRGQTQSVYAPPRMNNEFLIELPIN